MFWGSAVAGVMRSPSKFEGGKSHFSDSATTVGLYYLK
jgi:hypothetical protein